MIFITEQLDAPTQEQIDNYLLSVVEREQMSIDIRLLFEQFAEDLKKIKDDKDKSKADKEKEEKELRDKLKVDKNELKKNFLKKVNKNVF